MNERNPYEAPQTPIVGTDSDSELAGLGERLGAALIDVVLMMLIVLPVMFVGGYFDMVMEAAMRGQQVSLLEQVKWGVIGTVIFYLVQGYPLSASGQTWGKRILKIKIVDLQGRKPSFARLAGLRYLPMQLANLIPFVGGLIALVNVLMIFRSDRRCGHDLIAGTRVVNAR
ncbi:MAG: RDD family protein [Lysobacter sp.]|nr:RDD family protein [Lysobacter sp.]